MNDFPWSLLDRVRRSTAKPLLLAALVIASGPLGAGQNVDGFPKAAVAFLDGELPGMEAAVAAGDRGYFKGGAERAKRFLEGWGLRSDPAALDRFPACTDAISDLPLVGLCRISPPGTLCEPATFIPKFESNVVGCRAAAR